MPDKRRKKNGTLLILKSQKVMKGFTKSNFLDAFPNSLFLQALERLERS